MFDSGSYDRRVMFDSMVGNSTNEFLSNFTRSSESLGKEVKSYSASKTKELREAILKAVKSQGDVQKNAKECKKLFRQKADPEMLRELLKEQRKNYDYIDGFLQELKKEVMQSKKLKQIEKIKIEKIIMELITDIFSKNSSKDHSSSTIQNQSNHRSDQVEDTSTPRLSSSSDSRLGTSEESSFSLRNSRGSSLTSVTSILSEEDLNLILGSINRDKDQMHPEQAAPEESQVSFQRVTLESREKESWIPVSSTGMTSNLWKSEEKKDTEIMLPVNEKKGEVKQPNNRNFHVALAVSCTLLAIGCIVAGAMTLGLGLFAVAAVFAIATAIELRSNVLSSKLTSVNVSPVIDSLQHGKN